MTSENIETLNSSIEAQTHENVGSLPVIGLSSLDNPSACKARLRQLLRQVEKEFESLLVENIALRKELDRYATFNQQTGAQSTSSKLRASNILPMIRNRVVLRTNNPSDELLFSSSDQHKDVIWDVQVDTQHQRYFVSASADRTAIIWSRKNGRALLQYQGHRGSVNSCRFTPSDDQLVLSSSGDHEIHLWRPCLDENKDDDDDDHDSPTQILRSPMLAFKADHVISCSDWLQRDHIVSASWDRSATLWQVEMGSSVRHLYGHDAELTHVSCHSSKPLLITSSRDATFRLWDCRTPSQSVQIFNGHTKTVNCALFAGNDRLVSSSDDGFVHIWDSRSTSCSPLISIECVSPCNRISISNDVLAVPLDNRDIRLYSAINADKIHVQRRAHTRAIQCAALVSSHNHNEFHLLTGSLDRHVRFWHIKNTKSNNNTQTSNSFNTTSMKIMKSLDESFGSPNSALSTEMNKNNSFNNDGQQKKANKRTPLTEKANNLVASIDKKQVPIVPQTSFDKQMARNLPNTIK